jgi:hypothetical protein
MLKQKKALQAIAFNNGLRLSTTKQNKSNRVLNGHGFFMPSIQLFVLNSFHKEYSMSFIQCPYCQSTHVRQTDSGNANANYFEQLQRCISPTQMAMFGMQVAKVRLFTF